MPTRIEWADETWNPVTGCTKVSEGCANCYAERMARRLAGRYGYPEAPHHFDVTIHEDKFDQPLRWKKPRRIFVCSMGDLFHEDVPNEVVERLFDVMVKARQQTFMVLTKRPVEMRSWMDAHYQVDSYPYEPNVLLGVSAENQKCADERIPILLSILAAGHFVSLEPLLGPVDVLPYLSGRRPDLQPTGLGCYTNPQPVHVQGGLDWVIAGSESGPGARPTHPAWVRSVRDQCQAMGVPFLFKQWGAWVPVGTETGWNYSDDVIGRKNRWVAPDGSWADDFGPEGMRRMARVGKKRAGCLLDGREWNEYPEASQ